MHTVTLTHAHLSLFCFHLMLFSFHLTFFFPTPTTNRHKRFDVRAHTIMRCCNASRHSLLIPLCAAWCATTMTSAASASMTSASVERYASMTSAASASMTSASVERYASMTSAKMVNNFRTLNRVYIYAYI